MNEQPSADSTSDIADQAREAVQNVTDKASDTASDASRRSADYFRRSSQVLGDVDVTTAVGLFIAGAVGFGIGWLVLGQQSRSSDYVARRMGDSSERNH
jgi:ElaB/YqjD/DUF883 family membrane-anchored ribosome-binding protein